MTACVPPTRMQVFPLRVQTNHAYDLLSPRTHTILSPPNIRHFISCLEKFGSKDLLVSFRLM